MFINPKTNTFQLMSVAALKNSLSDIPSLDLLKVDFPGDTYPEQKEIREVLIRKIIEDLKQADVVSVVRVMWVLVEVGGSN